MTTTAAIRPHAPEGGGEPAPSGPQPPEPRRRAPGARRLTRPFRLRTVPGRLRVIAIVAVLAVAGLFAALAVAVNNARDGLQVIGHDAGPQVVATGNLLFALSDMDAQVADILLIGREANLGTGRQTALRRYEQRRAEAADALLRAARLAGDDPVEQRTVRLVIEGLGRYERLASQAILLDTQAAHLAGPPSARVTELYRQATDLMKVELLPKAYNLTLDSGTTVRRTYDDKHAAVRDGQYWVLGAGVVLLAILLAAQLYLGRRFHRVINPALALATLMTVALTVLGFGMLSAEAGKLRTAKRDGFDSVLALSRARAISNSAYADESRYLLDPGRADVYDQVYFDKSQAVLYVDAGSLGDYYTKLGSALGSWRPDGDPKGFLGLFGDVAHGKKAEGQTAELRKLLNDYRQFQETDKRMRGLVAQNKRREAIGVRMGKTPGSSIHDFQQYDNSLNMVITAHRKKFDDAVDDGDGLLTGWNWGLPAATIVMAALIVAGVRPRLAEYR